MSDLTVILAVYNARPYLESTITSVLRQTYSAFEMLIIDDGSNDGSDELLSSIRDPRVKIRIRENRGAGATRHELYEWARTEYVAHMDADDICEPNRLERQMEYLGKHQDVVMLGTSISFLVGAELVAAPPRAMDHDEIRARLLEKRAGAVCHPTIIVKRSAWQQVGGYHVPGTGEDLDYILRLSEVGRIANLPDVLYRYRLHENSLCSTRWRETRFGHQYGVACAAARMRGETEPAYHASYEQWAMRPAISKIGEKIDAWGEEQYRKSIIRKAQGRRIESGLSLLASALCRPRTAVKRVFADQ